MDQGARVDTRQARYGNAFVNSMMGTDKDGAPRAAGGPPAGGGGGADGGGAFTGPPRPMPFADKLEDTFGVSFADVDAFFGPATTAACEAQGANAVTMGNRVGFRESSPTFETVAHEATHVVQQRGGGVGGASVNPEAEAADAAKAASQGRTPEVSGSEAPTLRREAITGDPGTSSAGGVHSYPQVSDGTQVAADGSTKSGPTDVDAPESAVDRRVKVIADAGKALRQTPTQTPSEDKLVTTVPKGGVHVTTQKGTIGAPSVWQQQVPDSLYIGGGPSSADVRQGGIGDCYFEAVLLGLVARDPAAITGSLHMNGGSVSADFYHLDTASNKWVSSTVTTDASLQFNADAAGNQTSGLVGAGFRLADAPKYGEWYAETYSDTLSINRLDYYETAMWAPLMEKCYARFTQQWGPYGTGKNSTAPASGYDVIDQGGSSEQVYRIFYGQDVVSADTENVNYGPNSNPITSNLPALRRLLELQNDVPGAGNTNFLQARISPAGSVQRLKAEITSARSYIDDATPGTIRRFFNTEAEAKGAEWDRLDRDLLELQNLCSTWLKSQTATNLSAMVTKAEAVIPTDVHPLLRSDGHLRGTLELLGIVANNGTDNGPGMRQTYSAHAYNVLSVKLAGSDGKALSLRSDELATRATEIDAEQSQVTMQNPHAKNEPNLDGSTAPDGVNEGRFTLSLASFFRSIDLLRAVTVDNAPVGDFPTPANDGTAYA